MAVIYLKHPQHGTKVAIEEAEASHDESKGWSRFDPNITNAVVEEIVPVSEDITPLAIRENGKTRKTIKLNDDVPDFMSGKSES